MIFLYLLEQSVIYSHSDLMYQLDNYASPRSKLIQLIKEGTYIQVRRGLFVDDPATPRQVLAPIIYSPSYISFQYVLSQAGLIPEGVKNLTSASFGKNKNKVFRTPFGEYHYWPVPRTTYPHGIRIEEEGGISYLVATPEKALCDSVYKVRSVTSINAMENLLLYDWRIERSVLITLDWEFIAWLAPYYGTKSLRALSAWLNKEVDNG